MPRASHNLDSRPLAGAKFAATDPEYRHPHVSTDKVEKLEGPPPCFNYPGCGDRAALEKGGRSLCRACAARIAGVEYPLRRPVRAPLSESKDAAAESMEMIDRERRR